MAKKALRQADEGQVALAGMAVGASVGLIAGFHGWLLKKYSPGTGVSLNIAAGSPLEQSCANSIGAF